METTTLEMNDISIEFPGVKALKKVAFSARTGQSHALVGANGAGKSTLMKVLAGAYNRYSGGIFLNGREEAVRSPRTAKDLGIQAVYQEVDTSLVPYLSVSENIMLDRTVNDMGARQLVRWRAIHREAEKILDEFHVSLDVRKPVSAYTLAQKQMILIARAISRECRFLILDEPTAPLSRTETEELFRVIRKLVAKNIGVIFISHRLSELFEICDEITVLRDGEFINHSKIKDTNLGRIVELMLGRSFEENYPRYHVAPGDDVMLDIRGLNDGKKVRGADFRVRAGEIVGMAGLVGAGKSELCKALFGASNASCDSAILKGKELQIRNPFVSVRQGLALVPEERRKEGILAEESVASNLTAASLGKFCGAFDFISLGRERKKARETIAALDIKTPGEYQRVKNLSGGNQQKVALGKWLIAEADVYIFDEPTKGIDVGAKRDIFELMGKLAQNGKSIIYASCELAEIIGITDRVYVMYNGRIVKELVTAETNEKELLFYATGGR